MPSSEQFLIWKEKNCQITVKKNPEQNFLYSKRLKSFK